MESHMSNNIETTMAYMKTIVKALMNYKETKFPACNELNNKQNYDELKRIYLIVN